MLTATTVGFFLELASPLHDAGVFAGGGDRGGAELGIAGVVITTVLLLGALVLLVGRFGRLPFGAATVLFTGTGAQVRQVLEEGAASRYGVVQVSGLTWAFDASAPFGSRVTRVTLLGGSPIDPNATYRVATNNFMASGGDQFTTLRQGTGVVDTGVNLVDTVVGLLGRTSPVDPQVEGRLTLE